MDIRRADDLTRWMGYIPLVGRLVRVFWFSLLYEGIVGTCTPRWGALTFSFLNDGMKPTLWHTWYSITHDNTAPLSGIYPSGAPKSRREAERMAR